MPKGKFERKDYRKHFGLREDILLSLDFQISTYGVFEKIKDLNKYNKINYNTVKVYLTKLLKEDKVIKTEIPYGKRIMTMWIKK